MIRKIIQKLPAWTLTTVCLAAILYLTLVPEPLPEDTPRLFPGADKVVHAIMFGGLTYCFLVDYKRKRGLSGRHLSLRATLFGIAVSIAVGGAIEITQSEMQMGRSGDVVDLLFDGLGAIVAGLLPVI